MRRHPALVVTIKTLVKTTPYSEKQLTLGADALGARLLPRVIDRMGSRNVSMEEAINALVRHLDLTVEES